MLIDELKNRKAFLEKTISIIKRNEENYPEGKLWCSSIKRCVIFYHITKDGEKHYIPQSDKKLVSELAQKEYDKNAREACEKELAVVDELISHQEKNKLLEAAKELNINKRPFITPYILSGEEFRKKWESEQYTGKPINDNEAFLITARGERVRSKSEKIIADYFYYRDIPYKYEHPTKMKDGLIIYSDFTVLNVRTMQEYVLEFFGMMDNPEYANSAVRKLNTYEKSGYFPGKNLITLFETSMYPLNQKILEAIVDEYFI
ncbi:MAG: hypothetical protein IJU01_02275 [Lachnospiraceae bacterium]|nr:hypothetical protein [Lachnospiraceae bacterium]